MINLRHILNLSIELIIKPQALDKTSYYKCIMALKGRLVARWWKDFQDFQKKVFKKVLKESQKAKKVQKVRFSKTLKKF
jgi:hypothetical protein